MSEDNKPIDDNTLKPNKFEEFYNLAISQLQELIENFELEYEKNQNPESLSYAEDLKRCIEDIKKTIAEEELSPEKQKVFADYVEELIDKYSNLYLTILAVEALRELAEIDPKEFEKMPKWEDVYNNDALEYDPINNLENASNENINENDFNNSEMIAYYNQFLSALTNNPNDKNGADKQSNENESEKN